MKALFVLLAALFSINSFAQVEIRVKTLDNYDHPNLKCSDSLGSYYLFYKLTGPKPYMVVLPDAEITAEMVTSSLEIKTENSVAFTVMTIFGTNKMDMTLHLDDQLLMVRSFKTGKLYTMGCQKPE